MRVTPRRALLALALVAAPACAEPRLATGIRAGDSPPLRRMPSNPPSEPPPPLLRPLGPVATAAGAAATACAVVGWALLPTALWSVDRGALLRAFATLQLPLLLCGALMAAMLGAQRRGGQHTSPAILWLVSRLTLFPTPAIFQVLHWLGRRGYYHHVPMPEDGDPAAGGGAARGGPGPLLVGGLPLPWHVLELRSRGVRAVVNCCDEFGGWTRLYDALGITQLRLPTTDYLDVSAADLRRAVRFVDARRARGHGVYVHCKAGVGRAGSVAVAYLAARGEAEHRLDPKAANAYVRKFRPPVAATLHQRRGVRAVVSWARRLAQAADGADDAGPGGDGADEATPIVVVRSGSATDRNETDA